MKRDTVSFFRLILVIIGYLIYNVLFYLYPSREVPSFAWFFCYFIVGTDCFLEISFYSLIQSD